VLWLDHFKKSAATETLSRQSKVEVRIVEVQAVLKGVSHDLVHVDRDALHLFSVAFPWCAKLESPR
jgi:hypothetical protein